MKLAETLEIDYIKGGGWLANSKLAKRAAWLVCAKMLNWEVVSAEGPENEVYGRIVEILGKKGILPEGQVARKEVK